MNFVSINSNNLIKCSVLNKNRGNYTGGWSEGDFTALSMETGPVRKDCWAQGISTKLAAVCTYIDL